MKTFKSILIAALFLTVSNGLMAQTTTGENISANATVLSSVELAGTNDLEFGEVALSQLKVIAPTDTDNAGQFTLRTNTAAVIAFTLPANLTTTVDGQVRELPTIFNDDYAIVVGYDNAGAEQTETFNPTVESYNLNTGTADFDHANEFTIYLGGAVQASANQAAGDYTGTVTLSVTYN